MAHMAQADVFDTAVATSNVVTCLTLSTIGTCFAQCSEMLLLR